MKNVQKILHWNFIVKNVFLTFSILLLLNSGAFAQVLMSNQDKSENDVSSVSPSSDTYVHDMINFLDGKQICADVISIDGNTVKYLPVRKQKNHFKECSLDNVFSIVYKNGTEKVLYRQDTSSDDRYMTAEEMSNYVQGAQDARKNFRSPFSTISGAFTGAASAIIGFWSVPLIFIHPYVCASWVSEKKSAVNENIKSDTAMMNQLYTSGQERSPVYGKRFTKKNPDQIMLKSFKYDKKPQLLNCYNMGYNDAAAQKKAFNAIKGNLGGFMGIVLLSMLFVL
jgi:hypothetical protein